MRDRIARFKTVLKTKEMARDEVQRKLADLRSLEDGLLARLKTLRDDKQAYMDRFCEVARGGVTIELLRISNEDIYRTEIYIKRGIVDLLQLRKRIEEAEAELIERHKEVRKVELYLDQMVLEWKREKARQEQKTVDDIAGILYDRKDKEGGGLGWDGE